MTRQPERAGALSLKGEVEKHLRFLPELERHLDKAVALFDASEPEAVDVLAVAVGSAVADVYKLVENVLKLIAREFEDLPSGPEWHKELLDAATIDLPGIRPPIISDTTRAGLNPLREFRHVVRNIYGTRIDPPRARERVAIARRALPAFRADIAEFLRFLDALASA